MGAPRFQSAAQVGKIAIAAKHRHMSYGGLGIFKGDGHLFSVFRIPADRLCNRKGVFLYIAVCHALIGSFKGMLLNLLGKAGVGKIVFGNN